MDDSRIRTAAELISALISPKAAEAAGTWAKVSGAWPSLAGGRAAPHSRIADIENHLVTVEVDHPGWIQLLQFRQARILEDLRQKFPALEIRALQFRLARLGSTVGPSVRPNEGSGTGTGRSEDAEGPPLLDPDKPAATAEPLRLDPSSAGDETLRKALSGLRDAFEGR